MKNEIRIAGKLLVYNMKKRRDSAADIWIGPYVVEAAAHGHAGKLRSTFGGSTAGTSARMAVPAPMPGLVNRVDVALGATVKAGDPLLVLEAMKMENVIRAGMAGKVTKLNATAGKSVEKGEELVVIQADSGTSDPT